MIDNIFGVIKALLQKQFIRFLFVGAINTLFGYGVFAFFIFIQVHYAIAAFLATVIGIIFNFKTTGIIVFKSRDNKLIVRFFMVYGIVYIINVIGLKIFNYFHVSNYIAGLILVLPLAIISFLLFKKFVFTQQ